MTQQVCLKEPSTVSDSFANSDPVLCRLICEVCVCVSGDKGDSVSCSGPPGDKGPPGDFGPSGDDLAL